LPPPNRRRLPPNRCPPGPNRCPPPNRRLQAVPREARARSRGHRRTSDRVGPPHGVAVESETVLRGVYSIGWSCRRLDCALWVCAVSEWSRPHSSGPSRWGCCKRVVPVMLRRRRCGLGVPKHRLSQGVVRSPG
jgi:hypothetical protein